MKFKISVYDIWETGQRKDARGNPHQEDSIYPPYGKATPQDRLFILCDGMGGHDAGEVASATVCETMARSILSGSSSPEGKFTPEILRKALADAFDALDARDTGALRKMGTTLALLKLYDEGACVAHMGDSRVYQIRPGKSADDTRIVFRTQDHSLVNELVRLGEMTEEEARVSPRKNIITRAMQPHTDPRPRPAVAWLDDIQPGDYFYLCSDGMLEQMTDAQLCFHFSEEGGDDARKIKNLITVTAGNSDNHTAQIIHILDVMRDSDPIVPKSDSQDALKSAASASPKKTSDTAPIPGNKKGVDTKPVPKSQQAPKVAPEPAKAEKPEISAKAERPEKREKKPVDTKPIQKAEKGVRPVPMQSEPSPAAQKPAASAKQQPAAPEPQVPEQEPGQAPSRRRIPNRLIYIALALAIIVIGLLTFLLIRDHKGAGKKDVTPQPIPTVTAPQPKTIPDTASTVYTPAPDSAAGSSVRTGETIPASHIPVIRAPRKAAVSGKNSRPAKAKSSANGRKQSDKTAAPAKSGKTSSTKSGKTDPGKYENSAKAAATAAGKAAQGDKSDKKKKKSGKDKKSSKDKKSPSIAAS